jgi:tRNA isopentenyl-2-thiomethyl-A-37 hydroxylase MiaE
MAFDIERFLELSKAVDTSDLDWDYIRRVGVTDEEARALRYMADVESHTIIYLRDLLSGHTARDPEITSFLSCWVYEELNHGRAINKFLSACGLPPPKDRYTQIVDNMGPMEHVEAFLTTNVPKLTPHFAATHMTWGAVNEMMAASAYTQLAYYTQNKELSKLLLRLAKDERRHQSFYYHQAERRLQHAMARRIATFAMRVFWAPVGMGVGDDMGLEFIAGLLFDDERGSHELRLMDRRMSELPGFEWFDRVERSVLKAIADFRRKEPARAEQIRARKTEIAQNKTAKQKADFEASTVPISN